MKSYETLTEALSALSQKGYTTDFSLLTEKECLYCHKTQEVLDPDDFLIDEMYHFDGETDPSDEVIIYAISSDKFQIKGTLLHAFGAYADVNQSKIVEKLRYRNKANKTPIKRSKELIQLSREHHHALLLGWKIKRGIQKNVELSSIEKYAKWFYLNHLKTHFEIEEKYVFPLLEDSNENKKIVLAQHQQLKNLFEKENFDKETLHQINTMLTDHIRFEERILFNEIQQSHNAQLLGVLQEVHHQQPFIDNESDPFWL
ncbi:MAG: hemerythrin domain-containing protein [Chitinophagaceae bacterium]|nr:MAG: phosphoribosylpyrophosphate synthetase [Bacteroidetes bacterium OLB11]MCC6447674.1 hemerythrin domain-containing protein [Chitinophagaceae bacterium]HMN32380.1 hemerythrin domain-containing protein [Chitinophagaceae bacterium]